MAQSCLSCQTIQIPPWNSCVAKLLMLEILHASLCPKSQRKSPRLYPAHHLLVLPRHRWLPARKRIRKQGSVASTCRPSPARRACPRLMWTRRWMASSPLGRTLLTSRLCRRHLNCRQRFRKTLLGTKLTHGVCTIQRPRKYFWLLTISLAMHRLPSP